MFVKFLYLKALLHFDFLPCYSCLLLYNWTECKEKASSFCRDKLFMYNLLMQIYHTIGQ